MRAILLLLLLAGCSSKVVTKPSAPPVVVESPKAESLVNVIKFTSFKSKEIDKAKRYIPVMDKTIRSKCFADFMMARDMVDLGDKTKAQVIQDLTTKTVDIELITYYKRWSKVHGYTYPSVNKIWLNRKYHAGASLCSEASNLAHELGHKLGYKHAYKATRTRPYSVPYSINAAFKVCCR